MRNTRQWMITTLIACVLLSAVPPTVTAQDSKGQVYEALRLRQQATGLYDAGRYDEALPLAEQAVEKGAALPGGNRVDECGVAPMIPSRLISSQKYITPKATIRAPKRSFNES